MGTMRNDWLQAEQDATRQSVSHSIEDDAILIRLPVEDFPDSTIVVSITARSVLIFSIKNREAAQEPPSDDQECLHILRLPMEIDIARVACSFDGGHFELKLPLAASALT